MAPPFRAEQIGSLLRPQELLQEPTQDWYAHIFEKKSSSSSSDDNGEEVLQKAISNIVQEQLARKIRPITSGEYDRRIFYAAFFGGIKGFEVQSLKIPEDFRPGFPTTTELAKKGITGRAAIVATGRIKYEKDESPGLVEWKRLRSCLPEELWKECKVTIPSPTYHHMQLKKGTAYGKGVYENDEEFFEDLVKAFREEVMVLYEAGVRSIQVDDPQMTFFLNESFLKACKEDGVNPDELLDRYIKVLNDCIRDKPDDLHVGIHLCRGNFSGSTHFSEGSYERIAPKLFGDLDYDTFYLEYDSARAGGVEPLRFLSKDKNVVLGVVSTKDAKMEDILELEEKVLQAADVVAKAHGTSKREALENFGVSPQCGFSSASSGGGQDVTMEVMWKKMQLVNDLSKKLWGYCSLFDRS